MYSSFCLYSHRIRSKCSFPKLVNSGLFSHIPFSWLCHSFVIQVGSVYHSLHSIFSFPDTLVWFFKNLYSIKFTPCVVKSSMEMHRVLYLLTSSIAYKMFLCCPFCSQPLFPPLLKPSKYLCFWLAFSRISCKWNLIMCILLGPASFT